MPLRSLRLLLTLLLTLLPTLLAALSATLLALCLPCAPALAQEQRLAAINTYHYPPFVYPDGSGLARELVDHLNARLEGRYRFELQHVPRMRLLRAHLDGPRHFDAVGLLLSPSFVDDDSRTRYLWSAPVFDDFNVLVFAGAKAPPVHLLSDLKGMRYGGVNGYRYLGLETMAADGSIRLDLANDELSNLRKLLAGRVDFTQMNRFMYHHLAARPEFAGRLSYIRMPGPNAFSRHLFVARDRPELLAAINEALATLPCNPRWQAMVRKTDIVAPPCPARP